MSILTPPIEVLEHCLTDRKNNTFNLLIEPSLNCARNISDILNKLTNILLVDKKYSRFPNLCFKIKDIINNELIKKNLSETNQMVNYMIKMEEKYIWTDDELFLKKINDSFKYNTDFSNPNNIRSLLNTYFICVQKNINNNIPKIIMMSLVKKTEEELPSIIFEQILKNDISSLIEEESDIRDLRKEYSQQLEKINSAKKYIESSI